MMYLPYKSDQRDEAIKLMVDIFALVLSEKVAEEVVRRDVAQEQSPEQARENAYRQKEPRAAQHPARAIKRDAAARTIICTCG